MFNEDLNYTKQINWENTLQKMENYINELSPRVLSLYGKVILLDTLIFSKTTYLSNFFPSDGLATSKVHKN